MSSKLDSAPMELASVDIRPGEVLQCGACQSLAAQAARAGERRHSSRAWVHCCTGNARALHRRSLHPWWVRPLCSLRGYQGRRRHEGRINQLRPDAGDRDAVTLATNSRTSAPGRATTRARTAKTGGWRNGQHWRRSGWCGCREADTPLIGYQRPPRLPYCGAVYYRRS